MSRSPAELTRALVAAAQRNHQLVELMRSAITVDDHDECAKFYWTLDTWEQKAAVIDLVQDKISPTLAPIMRDFLRAPLGSDDTIWLGKAIAILHLRGSLSGFNALYDGGPALVEREARALLATWAQ